MKNRLRLALVLMALCPAFVWAAERPNVIVIMADDLGAEGLNCYCSTIYITPPLDRMAAEGLRIQQYLCHTAVHPDESHDHERALSQSDRIHRSDG